MASPVTVLREGGLTVRLTRRGSGELALEVTAAGAHATVVTNRRSVDVVDVLIRSEGVVLGERFWSRVREEDRGYVTPCLVWQGPASGGYGLFWAAGRSRGAHRLAFEAVHGPLPKGLEPDHLCRVKMCVREDHMEAVTHQENVRRSHSPMGINARLATCRRGHPFTGKWRGRRTCRTCGAERQRRHRAKAA